MKISAVDQLVVINDGDSYASSMGVIYPTNGGNAQYYSTDGTHVQPEFENSNGKKLIFYPIMYSAAENKYLVPTGQITWRFNSRTSQDAIIAQGTMGNMAVVSKQWNTDTDPDKQRDTSQTYAEVFQTGTYELTNPDNTRVVLPTLEIIGQLAYRTHSDIAFYCSCEVGDTTLVCKGDVEIRSLASENYKVIITAVNGTAESLGSGSNDTVINSANEIITLTAHLLKNGTAQEVSGDGNGFNWHKFNDNTSLGSSQTLNVTESMVDGVAEFVCDVTYGGSTYSASITINDIQDQYMIDKGRKTYSDDQRQTEVENTGILKPSYVVAYSPKVVDKSTGGDAPGTWTWDFVRSNAAGTVIRTDNNWNLLNNPYIVSGAEVQAAGGMGVHITATNSSI